MLRIWQCNALIVPPGLHELCLPFFFFLVGMVAGLSGLPVISVPLCSSKLDGKVDCFLTCIITFMGYVTFRTLMDEDASVRL